MQDNIAFRFSGEYTTECTIASTTMMLDLATRSWSKTLLDAAGVDPAILPPTVEAGTQIGAITAQAARETGLCAGTPVVTGGHDCEIAVLGAGVSDPSTFIDITGTWEILIASLNYFKPEPSHFERGLDFECHAQPGKWICQSLLIAGGVIEWVRGQFYRDVPDDRVYATMFGDAEQPSAGVYVLPSFMRGMGPNAAQHALGTVLGLTTATTRGQVVRATLEGLCFQLRQQVEAIQHAVGMSAQRLRVVGGGQKNPLWLQMKSDMTGLPVEVTTHPEVTLLGVALLAGVGAGVYGSVDEAFGQISFPVETVEPNRQAHEAYGERYETVYSHIARDLSQVYGAATKPV
jgi:sugar (pentulose or hexulose) kinase